MPFEEALSKLTKPYELLVKKKTLEKKITDLFKSFGKKSTDKKINAELLALINRVLSPFSLSFEIQDAYFDDKIICAFFSALCNKNKSKAVDYIQPVDFKHMGAKIKDLSKDLSIIGHQLKQAKLIFWPISDENQKHWYLLVIKDNQNQTFDVLVFDGLNMATSAYLDKGAQLLKALYPSLEDIQIKKRPVAMPPQDNLRDCGPFICLIADLICKGEDFTELMSSEPKTRDYTFARIFPVGTLLAQQSIGILHSFTTKQKIKKLDELRTELRALKGSSRNTAIDLSSDDENSIDLTHEDEVDLTQDVPKISLVF